MPISVFDLEREWAEHPLGARRATGGRWSLHGFGFQLADSLLELVRNLEAHESSALLAFEGLSDLAVVERNVVCLVQMKATLDRNAAKDAAREALAIDAFLEQTHPDLRERARYEVRCLRLGTTEPRDLSARNLKLTGAEEDRWNAVRTRVRPAVVRGDPWVELVAELFPIADNPVALADELLGVAERMLGEHASSQALTRELVQRLGVARQRVDRPGRILLPEHFAAAASAGRALLGQRPALRDLASGLVMPRDDRVAGVVAAVGRAFEAGEQDAALAVVFLAGPSGVGKSVLLLQALETLTGDPALTVHRVEHRPRLVADALAYWRHATAGKVVLAVDELYSRTQQDSAAWEQIVASALDADWGGRLIILTSGPPEDLESFLQEARRDEAFKVLRHDVAELTEDERALYRDWVQDRSTVAVGPVTSGLFAVAALLAEVSRERDESVGRFTERFLDRCQGLEIREPMRAALAMNRLGFEAPAGLFAAAPGGLARLVGEGVVSIDDGDVDVPAAITVFHQRVAREMYESLLDGLPDHVVAGDLITAVQAAPPGAETRLALLIALGRGPTASQLGPGVVRELLRRLWAIVWNDGAPLFDELAPWFFACKRWDADLLESPERRAGLIEWMFNGPDAARALRAMWRVVRPPAGEQRTALEERLVAWMRTRVSDPGWTALLAALLRQETPRPELVELAVGHVRTRLDDPLWVDLLLALHPLRAQPRALVEQALRDAPPGARDERLWRLARAAGVPPRAIVGLVCRRMCRAPSRQVVAQGARWIADHAHPDDTSALRWALAQERDSLLTPLALRTLLSTQHLAPSLRGTVRWACVEWLERHVDSPEWPPTWLHIHAVGGSARSLRRRIHAAAVPWLDTYPGQRYWLTVVRQLISEDAAVTIPHLAAWLWRNIASGAWPGVWRDRRSELPDSGVAVAALWLSGNVRHPQWRTIFNLAWREAPGDRRLRDAGLTWLSERPAARGWLEVFATLAPGGLDIRARDGARSWLLAPTAIEHPAWWWVLYEAIRREDMDDTLSGTAGAWVAAHPGSCGVPEVQTLLARPQGP